MDLKTKMEIEEQWLLLRRIAKGVTRSAAQLKPLGERQTEIGSAVANLLTHLKARDEAMEKLVAMIPAQTLAYVEKRIYELRNERYLALQAGVSNEPAPLMPAPRPGSGEWVPQVREHTGVFARHHTDGRRRTADEFIGKIVRQAAMKVWEKRGVILAVLIKWAAAGGFLAALEHWLHRGHP